ncbi:MAG: chemotaxis protein CheD [Planctomycetota bacterium]|nr:chemotaxis protein CheD [Planctomycetota bacterium]
MPSVSAVANQSGLRVVDISEVAFCDDPAATLVTYSLGSCLGVAIYDPRRGVGGMAHCMLPLSKLDPAKAAACPGMFVDTGVTALLEAMFAAGCQRRDLVVKIAGCASLLDENGLFRIGERNHTVLRKILWKNDLLLAAEDVGGVAARTLYLRLADGAVWVRSASGERRL